MRRSKGVLSGLPPTRNAFGTPFPERSALQNAFGTPSERTRVRGRTAVGAWACCRTPAERLWNGVTGWRHPFVMSQPSGHSSSVHSPSRHASPAAAVGCRSRCTASLPFAVAAETARPAPAERGCPGRCWACRARARAGRGPARRRSSTGRLERPRIVLPALCGIGSRWNRHTNQHGRSAAAHVARAA